jgi:hypothetical protein
MADKPKTRTDVKEYKNCSKDATNVIVIGGGRGGDAGKYWGSSRVKSKPFVSEFNKTNNVSPYNVTLRRLTCNHCRRKERNVLNIMSVYLGRHSSDQVKKTEMGRTCGTYGGEERCIQGFSGET